MLKKLLHNSIKIFFIFSLLLFIKGEDFLYSQETGTTHSNQKQQEEHDTKDLEDLLKRYNTDQEQVIEDNSKLHNIDTDKNQNDVSKLESEIEALANSKRVIFGKNIPKKESRVTSVDDKLSESVKIALVPLQMLSEKELEKRFVEASKHTKIYPYLERFPKVMVFSVAMIKDPQAIPNLVKIVENKKRFMTFGGIMILSIIIGLFLKKLFYKADRSFLGVIFFFLMRVYTMLFIRLGIIYYFFSNELASSISVFKKVFL